MQRVSGVRTVCAHCSSAAPVTAAVCANCGSKLSSPSAEGAYSRVRDRTLALLVDIPFIGVSNLMGVLAARAVVASGWIPKPPQDLTIQTQAVDSITLWDAEPLPLKLGFFAVIFLWHGLAYCSLCHSSRSGATLGKRRLGIRVVNKEGGRVTFGRALGRELGKTSISLLTAVLPGALLQLLIMSGDPKRRAIHDLVAGTVVVPTQDPDDSRIGAWRILVSFLLPALATAALAAAIAMPWA